MKASRLAAAFFLVAAACGDDEATPAGGSGGAAASSGTWTASASSTGAGGDGGAEPGCNLDDESPEHIVALSAGRDVSLALTSRGRVACWGIADYGECGPAAVDPVVTEAVWIPGLDCIEQIDTDFTGFALNAAGEAFAWGTEFQGELGDGDGGSAPYASVVSVLLPGPASHVKSESIGGKALVGQNTLLWGGVWLNEVYEEPVIWDVPPGGAVFRSSGIVCQLDAAGRGSCRGENLWGDLGDGTLTARHELTELATDVAFETLVLGLTATCGVTDGREVYCWGDNRLAQLGIGVLPPLTAPIEERAVPFPTRLPRLGNVVMIDLAESGGCAIDDAGAVYCWGDNRWDRFAREEEAALLSPRVLEDLSPARSVALGDDHVCVLRLDDTVWCRGRGLMRGFYDNTPDEATQMQFPFEAE